MQAIKDTGLAQHALQKTDGLRAEAAAVLEYFNRSMAARGRAAVSVKRIERVQNWRLWTKYTICRR